MTRYNLETFLKEKWEYRLKGPPQLKKLDHPWIHLPVHGRSAGGGSQPIKCWLITALSHRLPINYTTKPSRTKGSTGIIGPSISATVSFSGSLFYRKPRAFCQGPWLDAPDIQRGPGCIADVRDSLPLWTLGFGQWLTWAGLHMLWWGKHPFSRWLPIIYIFSWRFKRRGKLSGSYWSNSSLTPCLAVSAHCHRTSLTQSRYSSWWNLTQGLSLPAGSLTSHLFSPTYCLGVSGMVDEKCFRFLDLFCFLSWYWTRSELVQWESWHEF